MTFDSGAVLVDSNVWITFFQQPLPAMHRLMELERVVMHSSVIGELLVGQVTDRQATRKFLLSLPKAIEANPWEAIGMIEAQRLFARGLQWNDILLLASAKLSGIQLWTRDKRLALAAEELGVGWSE